MRAWETHHPIADFPLFLSHLICRSCYKYSPHQSRRKKKHLQCLPLPHMLIHPITKSRPFYFPNIVSSLLISLDRYHQNWLRLTPGNQRARLTLNCPFSALATAQRLEAWAPGGRQAWVQVPARPSLAVGSQASKPWPSQPVKGRCPWALRPEVLAHVTPSTLTERGKESAHLSCPQQCLPFTSLVRPDLWTRQPNGSTSARCTSALPFTSALKPLLTTALGRSWQEAPVGCLVSVPSLCPVHSLVLGWQGARWQGCLVPGFPQMVSPCRQQQCARDERCLGGEGFSSLFLTR